MSEQPPRASGHLPPPGAEAAHRFDPDPEAPPMSASPRPASGPAPGIGTARPTPASGSAAPRPDPEKLIRSTAGGRLDQAADAARRLGHRAREQGGIAGRAEPIAYRVGDSLQNAASYVRDNDVQRMREDVEQGVRSAPFKSLAIAAVAGFLVGRMLR